MPAAKGATCIAHSRMREKEGLIHALQEREIPIRWTRRRGDMAVLSREANDSGCSLLLVAGGDGSIHEAANAILDSDMTLGIIPGGTGNDLARLLRIPTDPQESVRIALQGRTMNIDVGRMTYRRDGTTEERIFVNIAEAGFGASAVEAMERFGRVAGRSLAYPVGILAALAQYRLKPVRLRLDGRDVGRRRLTNLVVANGQYFGQGLRPAPHAQLDDGWLDILLMEGFSHWDIATRSGDLKDGPPQDAPGLHTYRARLIELEGPPSVRVEADGELLGQLPLRIEVVPARLRIRCP